MEPIWGFIWFIGLTVLTAIIGYRKRRSGITFALGGVAAGMVLGFITIGASGGNGGAAGLAFMLGPIGGLISVIAARNGENHVAEGGSAAGYRKCPYCAEAIRTEAVKCKHCGSSVEALGDHG